MRISKLKSKVIVFLFTSLVFSVGCKRSDKNFREIKNDDVTIQLTRLEGAKQSEGSGYKFRIIPSPTYISKHKLLSDKFWYHMDSCFYTEKNGFKTFAFIQPIANGQKANFEYLLQFDPAAVSGSDSLKLVYDDKFITQKNYTFNIQL
jgi:hypothetical protein